MQTLRMNNLIKNVCGSHQSLWVCSKEFYLPELLISLQSEVDGNCQLKRETWGQNNVDGREKIIGFARVPTCRVFQQIHSTRVGWFARCVAGCRVPRTHRLDLQQIGVRRRKGAPRHVKHADGGLDQ